jgi:soluble lytic murein transglycosylase
MQQALYSKPFWLRRAVLSAVAVLALGSAVSSAPTFAEPKKVPVVVKPAAVKPTAVKSADKPVIKAVAKNAPKPAAKKAVKLAASAKTDAATATTDQQRGDAAFLTARDAFRAGESVRLAKNVEALRGHPLQPWAEYWQLQIKLDEDAAATAPAISAFLERHAGSYLADNLRGDWLRSLGKRGDWENFDRELPALVQIDDDVRCYRGQHSGDHAIARSLFVDGKDLPAACNKVINELADAGSLSTAEVWQRIRRLFEAKRVGAARNAASHLPAEEGWSKQARGLETIAENPARHLEHLPTDFATTRTGRELALFAIQRLARSQPSVAASHLEKIGAKLRAEESAYGWSHVALRGAMTHHPDALSWFDKSKNTELSEDALAWRVRAALRVHDWKAVQQAVTAMPVTLAAQPDWIYWRARALQVQGEKDEARTLFEQIAGQPNFYSNLANDELGRSIQVPSQATAPTKEELAVAAANPAFQRALALFRVDMRLEGVREWVFALRGMDDRQLLAAASFAHGHEIWDRAINTADRTQTQHDYSLRFASPFSDQVRPKARELALDDAWVYGLMRQESRFIMNAKSSVGAKGLMQLMPATAQWVAKKINMTSFSQARVTEMDVNVTLGTNYMKIVLDSLDSHPVLASAAYNAGPGRAKRWRAEQPLEGAIYAETIPFSETRDYVKKVMSNAVYYSALFEQKPQSIKTRLGTIRARGVGERGIEELP